MLSGDKVPWYKNPLHLGVMIAALALAVSIIIYIHPIPQPRPDFIMSIDPMTGSVEQGGFIQSSVTVKSINGYNYPVTLSATGQPSTVIIAFNPASATPAYASGISITTKPNVPPNDYPIKINGIGGDGTEHSCTYILTVKSVPEQGISKGQTPEPYQIKIISPKNGDLVPISAGVEGEFSGELPRDQHMWLVVNPSTSAGLWWPQEGQINPTEGLPWAVDAWFGGDKDAGTRFDIAIVLLDKNDNQLYQNYINQKGRETGDWPGIPLPASAKIADKITVIRK